LKWAQAWLACRYTCRSWPVGGPRAASSAGQRLNFLAAERSEAAVTVVGAPDPIAAYMSVRSDRSPVTHCSVLVGGAGAVLGAGDARVCALGVLAAGRVAGAAALGCVAIDGTVGAERKR